MKVAVLGPKGSFSEEAALKRYGPNIEIVYAKSFDEVAKLVSKGKVDNGIIPCETTQGGPIIEAFDAIQNNRVFITEEIEMEPEFYMLTKEDDSKLKTVGSHPQGLLAAKDFLDYNFPQLERHETSSTSEAACIASKDPTFAAIASKSSSEEYELHRLHKIPPIKEEKLKKGNVYVYGGKSGKMITVIDVVDLKCKEYPEVIEELFQKHKKNHDYLHFKFT